MKKVLYLVFAVFVLSVMCFNVMPARAEVTFNGEWRVRGFAFDINGADDPAGTRSDTASYWDQRFRLYITAKVSDNLKGVIRMLSPNHASCDLALDNSAAGSSVGNRWGTSVDPREVLWDVAYLDFDVPQTNVNVKMGRQGIDLGNFILLGSCKTYDSLVLSTSVQNVNVTLLTGKFYEGATSGAFDDEDIYGIVIGLNPTPNMSLSLYGVMGNDGDLGAGYLTDDPNDAPFWPDADAFWFGGAATMDMNPIKVKAEVDYSKLTMNSDVVGLPDIEATGFAAYVDVTADLPMATVGANILYTTGDDMDDGDPSKSDQFIPISSYFSERADYDYIVLRTFLYTNAGGDWSIGNLTAIQLYAMKDLTPQLNGKVSVQNYSFTEDPDGSTGSMDTAIGTEVDVKLVYKMYDNLTLTGVGAYWFTTDDLFGANNDDCWLVKHEVLYKF